MDINRHSDPFTGEELDLYRIKDLFKINTFFEVLEELNPRYNHWRFGKREKGREELAGRGGLFKYDNEEADVYSLGSNLKLIDAGLLCKLRVGKILKRRIELVRVNTNVQFPGQEAGFHTDGNDRSWTLLAFMQSDWNTLWGGDFICQTENQDYVGIPYMPNHGVLFRGSMLHRGSAPNALCPTFRLSVAFTYQEYGN